jgi:hypothetical protein
MKQGSKTDTCKHTKQTTENNNSWSTEREQRKTVENKRRMKCKGGRTQVMISTTQIPFGKENVVLTECTE